MAAKKGAVKIITKSVSLNDFDEEYLNLCKPLLKNIGKKEENLLDCYPDIDKLLKNLDEFNKSPESEKLKSLPSILSDVDQLNAYSIVDSLRAYTFDNDHTDKLHKLWDFVND